MCLSHWLSCWIAMYQLPRLITLGQGACRDDVFGRCVHLPPGNPLGRRASVIYINEVLEEYPFLARATLWHEFCHAYFWVKEGRLVAHGPQWLRLFWSQPLLALTETFITPIAWCSIKRKR